MERRWTLFAFLQNEKPCSRVAAVHETNRCHIFASLVINQGTHRGHTTMMNTYGHVYDNVDQSATYFDTLFTSLNTA